MILSHLWGQVMPPEQSSPLSVGEKDQREPLRGLVLVWFKYEDWPTEATLDRGANAQHPFSKYSVAAIIHPRASLCCGLGVNACRFDLAEAASMGKQVRSRPLHRRFPNTLIKLLLVEGTERSTLAPTLWERAAHHSLLESTNTLLVWERKLPGCPLKLKTLYS